MKADADMKGAAPYCPRGSMSRAGSSKNSAEQPVLGSNPSTQASNSAEQPAEPWIIGTPATPHSLPHSHPLLGSTGSQPTMAGLPKDGGRSRRAPRPVGDDDSQHYPRDFWPKAPPPTQGIQSHLPSTSLGEMWVPGCTPKGTTIYGRVPKLGDNLAHRPKLSPIAWRQCDECDCFFQMQCYREFTLPAPLHYTQFTDSRDTPLVDFVASPLVNPQQQVYRTKAAPPLFDGDPLPSLCVPLRCRAGHTWWPCESSPSSYMLAKSAPPPVPVRPQPQWQQEQQQQQQQQQQPRSSMFAEGSCR